MLDSVAHTLSTHDPRVTIYVVFAELQDPSQGTADGEHFVMLAGYTQETAARQRAATEQAGGLWGNFNAPDAPSDTGWWLGVEPVELLG